LLSLLVVLIACHILSSVLLGLAGGGVSHPLAVADEEELGGADVDR